MCGSRPASPATVKARRFAASFKTAVLAPGAQLNHVIHSATDRYLECHQVCQAIGVSVKTGQSSPVLGQLAGWPTCILHVAVSQPLHYISGQAVVAVQVLINICCV